MLMKLADGAGGYGWEEGYSLCLSRGWTHDIQALVATEILRSDKTRID
jgi:hypothetical protein